MWILLQPDYSQMKSTAAPLIFIGIMIVVVTLGYFSMRSHIKKIDIPDEEGADGLALETDGPALEAHGSTQEADGLAQDQDIDEPTQGTDG